MTTVSERDTLDYIMLCIAVLCCWYKGVPMTESVMWMQLKCFCASSADLGESLFLLVPISSLQIVCLMIGCNHSATFGVIAHAGKHRVQ